jgi:hypothetical protein
MWILSLTFRQWINQHDMKENRPVKNKGWETKVVNLNSIITYQYEYDANTNSLYSSFLVFFYTY